MGSRQYPEKGNKSNGLFTLPDTDSDPDPGMDICPKNGYSSDWRTECESESESGPQSVSGNVNKP